MNSEKKKILKEQWEKVPSDIKAFILSPDLEKNIIDILTSNNLSLEKMKDFENETILLMMGMSGTEDYMEEVGKIFSLPENKAENILLDVEKLVLAPIKDSLIEFVDKENSAENTEKYQNQNDNKGKEIILENQNPFLPMLNKRIDSQTTDNKTTDRRQEIGDNKTADNKQSDVKEEQKIPNVTSALAAEIGNLIGKVDDRQRMADNRPGTIDSRELIPKIGINPMDKMSGLVHQPRIEVEMVRSKEEETSDDRQTGKSVDPYREAVE